MTLEQILIFCFLAGAIIFWKVVGGRQYGKSEKEIRDEAATEFAKRLKEKSQKPEYPWEDWFVSEDDIEEVLHEMAGGSDV